MNKFGVFLVIVIFVLLAGAGIYFAKQKIQKNNKPVSEQTSQDPGSVAGTQSIDSSNAKDIGAVFFYGSTCSYCKNVEQYFSDNKILEKIKVDQKEVYESRGNAKLMQDYLSKCKDLSDDDKGGVPFLYTPDKCIVGDKPIIDFFNQQLEALK